MSSDPACEHWTGSLLTIGESPRQRRQNLVAAVARMREVTMREAGRLDPKVTATVLILCRTVEALLEEVEQADDLLRVYRDRERGGR